MSETAPTPLAGLTEALAGTASAAPGHGHAGIAGFRAAGLTHFRALGLPTQRMEDWKYTSVRAIERRDFVLAEAGAAAPANAASLGCGADAACTFVFVDGRLAARHGEVPDGVTLLSLAEAIERDPDAVAAIAGSAADAGLDGFAALNAAAMLDGAWLAVRPGVTVAQPINLVFVASGTDGVAAMPRNLLSLGDGASAHVVEHYAGESDSVYLTNTVTEVVLGENARLEHSKLQEESRKAFHICTIEARQGAGSSFVSQAVSIGAALARHDINTRFVAPGSTCVMNGLYLGGGRQHVDFHTRLFHDAPDCTSQQHYKGILDGRSRGVFNGQVHVAKDAQRTDAEQSNHNLLLSRDAEIDTKPQLEIYADDVKCAHGITVGQLDENQMFYLRSRGVPEVEARGMLTYGFACDIAERLSVEALRERVEHVLMEVLPNTDALKEA